MRPEEVLELISSAPERYDTVRAALRYRGHGPTKKEIRERIVRRAFEVSPREAYKPIRHLEPDGPFGWLGEVLRTSLPRTWVKLRARASAGAPKTL